MLFGDAPTLYSYEPPKLVITELCDVCGCSGDTKEILRSTFFSPGGTKYVIRHHMYCNPNWHYGKLMMAYNKK